MDATQTDTPASAAEGHRTSGEEDPTRPPARQPGEADDTHQGGSGSTAQLDANELPFPAPPQVLAAVSSRRILHRYSDPDCTALVSALAEQLGVRRDAVLLGPGSSALLHRIIAVSCTGPGDAVMWSTPGFSALDGFAQQAGAQAQRIPLTPAGVSDLDAMAAAITPSTRTIILVNPHNPTGTIVTGDRLRAFLARIRPAITVVIDEAYQEFCRDPAAADSIELATRSWDMGHRVAVVRTFSKAYGLADLRIGYGIAPPHLARAVRAAAVPREIGGLAAGAALAALGAQAAMRDNAAAVVRERERVVADLRRLGYVPCDSRANFVFLPLGDAAGDFVRHCRDSGVLVSEVAGHGVRVTIGSRTENHAFVQAAWAWATARRPPETTGWETESRAGSDG